MKILLCVTESPDSEFAIDYGEFIAKKQNVDIDLLALLTAPQSKALGDMIVSKVNEGISFTPRRNFVKFGSPDQIILRVLQEDVYDMLILGDFDRSPKSEKILRRILSKSNASVLIARCCHNLLKNVLIATGGQELSEPTVSFGARLALSAGVKVTLVHVAQVLPSMYAGLDNMEESLSKLLQSDTPLSRHLKASASNFQALGIEAQIELRHGLPKEELLLTSELNPCDLLVIGKSAQRFIDRYLFEDISMDIATHAVSSVLIVTH